MPVVTGFLARGFETHAITTLGRGGSDLTATVIGAALGHDEVQVRCEATQCAPCILGDGTLEKAPAAFFSPPCCFSFAGLEAVSYTHLTLPTKA